MSPKIGFFEKIYLSIKAFFAAGQLLRIVKITVGSMLAVFLIFTVAGTLVEETKTFTIQLIPPAEEGEAKLSLSETEDFANPTTVLDAGGFPEMNNISHKWLPEDLDMTDGSHNGANYMAYTFYVKNTGDASATLTEQITLDSSVLGAEAAIRLRLYRDGEPTTYALLGADGNPEEGTTPFAGDGIIVSREIPDFEPEEVIKYTLVIWLEGDDPECLDNIMGGQVRMSMTFTVGESERT